MKIKPWLKYLFYITLISSLIFLREYVEKLFLPSYHRFEPSFHYLAISLLLGVCIGLFLGLDHLIEELKKEGTWKINLPKLILVGLPSLYFSFAYIWFLSGWPFINEIITYPLLYLFRYGSGFISLFQIILGYAIITSFFKRNERVLKNVRGLY